MRWDYLPRNPAAGAAAPRAARTRPRVWSPEQLLGSSSRCGTTASTRCGCSSRRPASVAASSPACACRTSTWTTHASRRTSRASWPVGRSWSPRPRPAAGSAGSPSIPRPSPLCVATSPLGRGAAAPRPGGRTAVRVAGRSTSAPGHHHLALPRPLRCRRAPPDPAARRAALLRHRGAEGGSARQDRVSERLGHATVAFTLQVYSHVLPGMDSRPRTRSPP